MRLLFAHDVRGENRGETGSLETAPSATQSCRCSHFGIARGLPPDFLVGFRRFQRSRARRRGGESEGVPLLVEN